MSDIATAVKSGNFEVRASQRLTDSTVQRLQGLGYVVEYVQCGRNEYEHKISW